jgi:hypothetical protein
LRVKKQETCLNRHEHDDDDDDDDDDDEIGIDSWAKQISPIIL